MAHLTARRPEALRVPFESLVGAPDERGQAPRGVATRLGTDDRDVRSIARAELPMVMANAPPNHAVAGTGRVAPPCAPPA
jgi:hypothetical protein